MTGLWFNPNIHPEDEYSRRLGAVRELAALGSLDIRYIGGYGLQDFERNLKLDGAGIQRPERCRVCYRMRMRETARECAKGGFDAFTSSLLVSPYQAHDLLVAEAEDAAGEYGVRFHYEDFRSGWSEGRTLSREAGFYRQYYCGCVYSRAERDMERAGRHGVGAKE